MTALIFSVGNYRWYVGILRKSGFLTVDGTLAHGQESCSKTRREAMRRLKNHVKTIICTYKIAEYEYFEIPDEEDKWL